MNLLPAQNDQQWLLALSAILGLLAGNVINILAYHMPRILQQNWRRQCQILLYGNEVSTNVYVLSSKNVRLYCLGCNAIIPAWMRWPLLRALSNIGLCWRCVQPVGKQYHWVEMVMAMLTPVIVLRFGVHLGTFAVLVLTWGLWLLAMIDSTSYLLPDCITLSLMWLGLFSNAFGLFITPAQAILGAVVGYASLWLVNKLYSAMRHREGIGGGDYKLLAVFGAWWGIYPLPFIVFLAATSGSIITAITLLLGKRNYDAPLPFGPYLVGGGLVAMLIIR